MKLFTIAKSALLVCAAILFARCDIETLFAPSIEVQIDELTLEEKVGQLFVVTPEYLAAYGAPKGAVTHLSRQYKTLYAAHPVGGVCLFAENIKDPEQLEELCEELHEMELPPLICIDEEGGRVARIAHNRAFDVKRFKSMADVAKSGSLGDAFKAGKQIGDYLEEFGFDVDFAPVADVNTNPQNKVIGDRAFSSDPEKAAPMIVAFLEGLERKRISGCIKHFPGHGDTYTDSHVGYAKTERTLAQMEQCEFIPFREAIDADVRMVMVAHISAPKVLGDMTPATLSPKMVDELLRDELGFEGVIITDGMAMGAIAKHYEAGEAAVLALEAGVDMVLMPEDFVAAYEGVLAAVRSGRLTEERIDRSLRRILKLKTDHGLY